MSSNGSTDSALAYESWKVHEAIVDRKENLAFRMRNWVFTLVIAIVISTISKKIDIPISYVTILCSVSILLFYIMEVTYKAPVVLSMRQVEEIIGFLNKQRDTFSPYLEHNGKKLFRAHLKAAFSLRTLFPYLVLEFLVIATYKLC